MPSNLYAPETSFTGEILTVRGPNFACFEGLAVEGWIREIAVRNPSGGITRTFFREPIPPEALIARASETPRVLGFVLRVSEDEWIARCFAADSDSGPLPTQSDAEQWVRTLDRVRGRSGAFEIAFTELPAQLY